MIWSRTQSFELEPFETEADLERAILTIQEPLFGPKRIYLDIKRKIGLDLRKGNIPDGYLIDLTSAREPKLYVVENELAAHEPLRHIAVQILQFSLSFETSPRRVKEVVKQALLKDAAGLLLAEAYARDNGYENIDYLLESIVFNRNAFNAMVIIDELPDDLETVLVSRFQFPVELITIERYCSEDGQRVYRFEPFLKDVLPSGGDSRVVGETIDVSEIDTIVVPARPEGFRETFMGEDRWYQIRIHSSMIPKIKYIAAYQVAPISAITHIAEVHSIEQWKDTGKYVVNFEGSPVKIGPIKLDKGSSGLAPQAPRYTSRKRLEEAKTLSEVFYKS